MRPALFLFILLGLAGCSRRQSYFPLQVGKTAAYSIRTGFSEHTDTLVLRRSVSVAGQPGVEVAGSFGVSRVGWKDGVLLADQLSQAQLIPAVPILAPAMVGKSLPWSGKIRFAGGEEDAKGELTQSKSSVALGGRTFETIHTKLVLDNPKRQIEVETDFAPEVGIVRQQQRTNGRFDLAMELLSER